MLAYKQLRFFCPEDLKWFWTVIVLSGENMNSILKMRLHGTASFMMVVNGKVDIDLNCCDVCNAIFCTDDGVYF